MNPARELLSSATLRLALTGQGHQGQGQLPLVPQDKLEAQWEGEGYSFFCAPVAGPVLNVLTAASVLSVCVTLELSLCPMGVCLQSGLLLTSLPSYPSPFPVLPLSPPFPPFPPQLTAAWFGDPWGKAA